ncbi:MAG: hypothetical protein JKY66_00145 [Spongiibacteraceae bacterium]|nr:hypothetical protein [Spongiibacteraceae bacterium]
MTVVSAVVLRADSPICVPADSAIALVVADVVRQRLLVLSDSVLLWLSVVRVVGRADTTIGGSKKAEVVQRRVNVLPESVGVLSFSTIVGSIRTGIVQRRLSVLSDSVVGLSEVLSSVRVVKLVPVGVKLEFIPVGVCHIFQAEIMMNVCHIFQTECVPYFSGRV